jgi:PAS domain S-box-containing protein
MPDAIVIVDPEGRIVGFNSMAQAMFGYDRTDVLGQPVELLMPDPVSSLSRSAWRRSRRRRDRWW